MVTLEERLKQLADISDKNMKLYNSWKVLKIQFEEKLGYVSTYFQHYSLHESTHSQTICTNIERLLGSDRIMKLSVTDIWMILMCSYTHDLGMALSFCDIDEFFNSSDFKKKVESLENDSDEKIKMVAKRVKCTYNESVENSNDAEELRYNNPLEVYQDVIILIEAHFRTEHASRSSRYLDELMSNFNSGQIINKRILNVINEINEIHQKDIKYILGLPYCSNGIADDYFHPRLIAFLLCIGDLLDLDSDRFSEEGKKILSPFTESSIEHRRKHESIKHFLVTPNVIELRSDSKSQKTYRLMRKWVDYIDEAIDFLKINWNEIAPLEFGYPPKKVNAELTINSDPLLGEYSNLRFGIEKDRAIELLQGANIYKSKFEFLRELIQNAVDASLERLMVELNIQKYSDDSLGLLNLLTDREFQEYKVIVEIILQKSYKVLVCVIDSGKGLALNDIESISYVGKSTKKVLEGDELLSSFFSPVGVFGIGMQSVFMVTDSFSMNSNSNSNDAVKYTFESGSNNDGYISIEKTESPKNKGTIVEVLIDPYKINSNEVKNNIEGIEYTLNEKSENIFNTIKDLLSDDVYTTNLYGINNFVPVTLKFIDEVNDADEEIYEENGLFGAELKKLLDGNLVINKTKKRLSDDDNAVPFTSFSIFDKDNRCVSEMIFKNNDESNEEEKSYELDDVKGLEVSDKLLFKNTLLEENFRRFKSQLNEILIFQLNILQGSSEEFLTISRGNLKKSAYKKVNEIYDVALKSALKKLIDILIVGEENGKYNIGLIFNVYQAVLYMDYKIDEFEKMYSQFMNTYKYHIFRRYNYFELEVEDKIRQRLFSIEELKKVFVFKFKLKSELLNDAILETEDSIKTNFDDYEIIDARIKGLSSSPPFSNIINNNVGMYIVRESGNNVWCYKLYRLFKSDEMEIDYKCNEIIKLLNFLIGVKEASGEVKADKNYDLLRVNYTRRVSIVDGIISPFNEKNYKQLVNTIKNKKENEFDETRFIMEIRNRNDFSKIVKLVESKKKVPVSEIEDKYVELIKEVIRYLMHNNDNQNFIRDYINNEEDELDLLRF